MDPFSIDAPMAAECPWPKHLSSAPPAEQGHGPTYVNAKPKPSAFASSSKALGITAAFFGMVFMIGAVAGVLSGKLNIEVPFQAWRGLVVFGMGATSLTLGGLLLRGSHARS